MKGDVSVEKLKKIIVLVSFALIIFGLALANTITADGTISETERRPLAQIPKVSAESVFSGKYTQELEKYLLDQFPARDAFRSLKAFASLKILQLSDNNGLYEHEGYIYRLEYPLNETQVLIGANKIESIIAAFPEMGNAYFSIIPDKNYFSPVRESHPAMDYGRMVELMLENVQSAEYIDIFDTLSLAAYYKTDTHWRQEELSAVVERLGQGMGVPTADFEEYKTENVGSFTGILAGQLAVSLMGEPVYYLTSEATENAAASSIETDGEIEIYSMEKFAGTEPYDIYLHGAQAIITIENDNAKTDRELIIFRDSFGSSLSPLLVDSYSKITIVDLRYVSSQILSEYVDFTDADVLFIYSTMLLNAAGLLK